MKETVQSQQQKRSQLAASLEMMTVDQVGLIEAQLEAQEETMAKRQGAAMTRANVLIGASAALGTAELITTSGSLELTVASLVLYLAAAALGLLAARPRREKEPDLPKTVNDYAPYATRSLRDELIFSRLLAHDDAVDAVNRKGRTLTIGFVVLAAAWLASGAGVAIAAMDDAPSPPTEIRIIE